MSVKQILPGLYQITSNGCGSFFRGIRRLIQCLAVFEVLPRAAEHGMYLKDIKPAATTVEVKSLISPELTVEIEATAITME